MKGPHYTMGIYLSNFNGTSSGDGIRPGIEFPQRNTIPHSLGKRRRRDTVEEQITQLSMSSVSETSDCDIEDNDDIGTTNIDLNGMRHVY
jgi:hypothetical protein